MFTVALHQNLNLASTGNFNQQVGKFTLGFGVEVNIWVLQNNQGAGRCRKKSYYHRQHLRNTEPYIGETDLSSSVMKCYQWLPYSCAFTYLLERH